MSVSIDGLVLISLLLLFNGFLGAIVILRNPRAPLNRAFLLMVFGITLWATSSTLSDATTNYEVSRYASFLAFGGSFFGMCATYLFSEIFLRGTLRRRHYIFMAAGTVLSVLFATPLVYSLDTIDTYHNGPLYALYIVSMVVVLGLIVRNFSIAMRRGTPQQRSHARLIVAGFAGMSILALITNAIIPALVDVTWVTKIGPLFTTIFIASVAYSMIRHRLFDMRLAVARTLAYVFTVGAIAIMYSALMVGVLSHFIDMKSTTWVQQIAYVGMAVVLAATFQPIKRFFDRLTNRLFYQDAYDAQELYTQLNKALVSSLDVKYLMMQSISIVETALKPDFAVIGLRDGADSQRLFTSRELNFKQEDMAKLRALTPHIRHKVIVTDDIESPKQTELKEILRRNQISVVVRLTQNVRSGEEGFGYLVLGGKKSGNPYTSQDSEVLDTVADELTIAIQNALHYEEIQQFNAVLQARVDDATRKLRRTNEKLKALDETKDDFISMASHQLRTPLTSVKGYLSMVLEGDAGKVNDTQTKMLSQAYVSSQRMVYLIADLLNVSRLKTGKFVIDAAPTDLSKIINEEIDQLVESAASRNLTLVYEPPKDFPALMLDETKIRQVIMNFIDNAIYYTPNGGHIRIELNDTGPMVELRVVDDGIGVAKAEQHHLFTKFYRAGNARKARPDGTGLGLFMAKKVITAQGGALLFESTEGKGSMFGFTFSKSKLAAPSAAESRPAATVAAKH